MVKRPLFFMILATLFIVSCQREPDILPPITPTPHTAYVHGRFTPPDGKTLFIIGQDVANVEAYAQKVTPAPGGFTEYTSLNKLEGITREIDYGSGPHHLDYLAQAYPHSVIALGLDLTGYLPAITSSQADHKIDLLLTHLAGYGRPVYLRFGYEFDGTWNHYLPDEYTAAWIYFWQKLQASGLENVAMVWQSAASCDGTYLDKPLSTWYPGDEYVDWVGISYFTQSDCNFTPLTQILSFARAHQKPVIIAESTPQRYDIQALTYSLDGHSYTARTAIDIWQEWFVPYFDFIDENADVIRAVAYINARWDDQMMWGPPYTSGYWGDTRIQINADIQQRWQAELNQEMWLRNQEDLFSILNSMHDKDFDS